MPSGSSLCLHREWAGGGGGGRGAEKKKCFSYFREQTKISPIMSVMHQIPGVALNAVSSQKTAG